MLFERLNERDIERIDSYRRTYAGSCDNQRADLSTILRFWSKNKEWMAPYFGDGLIKEIPISYKEGEEELYNKIGEVLYQKKSEYRDFINQVEKLYPYPMYREDDWEEKYRLHENICKVVSTRALVNNKIDLDGRTSVVFPLPNGDEIKVQDGMKPMKVLRQFAEVLGFEHFEEFRNAHSCCLQTKSLSGDLCLSIHPLDFMTMSDNDCGWHSCMSWRDDGEYRLGTVEMMNSPVVICAYLKSDKSPLSWYDGGEPYEWNSKKWRCLFIVDHQNFCVSVKAYPYYNSGLIKETMKEIAKLFNWGEREIVEYDYDIGSREGIEINGRKISIDFDTDSMYCDFGATDHWLMLGPTAENARLECYNLCYSGEANCMCCGDYIDYDGDDYASRLTCETPYEYCSCCDCRIHIYNEDYYWVEDERVCPYCTEEHAVYDNFRGDYVWRENATKVYLSRSNKKLTDKYDCETTWLRDNDQRSMGSYWSHYFNVSAIRYDDEQGAYFVYPKDCTTLGLREIFEFYGDTELEVKRYMLEYGPEEEDSPDEPTAPNEPDET